MGNAQDHGSLWHPFADMGAVSRSRMTIVRAEGVWVWDDAGERYLDGTGGLWFANLGHGRPEIADAVAAQLRRLDAYSIFGDYANPPAIELADRLAALAPSPGSHVFLGTGGGEMVEAAAKLARSYWFQAGRPEKTHLIGRVHSYHGTNGIGTSVGGIPANQRGFGPLVSEVATVAYDDPADLERTIGELGAERVAAFFCEPVIGAGGVHLPPHGYIEAVAEVCRRNDVLFVADCVICAFGRLGTWFGIDRWPVQPDMIVMAKGISNGATPVGALLVGPRVCEPFFTGAPGAPVFRHGATYSGHPSSCAAANAALDIYERDGLIERGATLEQPLAQALGPLADNPLVAEVRAGLGLLAAVEFEPEALAANPALPVRLQHHCRRAGVLVRPLVAGVAVSPPLTIEGEQIQFLGEAIRIAIDQLAEEIDGAATVAPR